MADEEGLLGKLAPLLRGAAGAAAVGANPLFGLLAGPAIRNTTERRTLENQARRAELRRLSRQDRARSELRGLLEDNTTLQGPTTEIPLLNPDGGATPLQIPGRRASVPTINTQGGQRELMGLLAEVAPDEVARSMLATPPARSETSLVRNLRAAGIDPASQEGRDIILQQLRGQGASEDVIKQIQLQMTALQLDEMRREREEKERTRDQQRKGLERSLQTGVSDIIDMTESVRELKGTFLQPGLPGGDFRRNAAAVTGAVRGAFGGDPSELQDNIRRYDLLNKKLSGLIIDTLDRFGGTMTDAKFRTLQEASATTDISPEAIESILQDLGDIYSQQAVDEGIEVRRLGELRKLFSRNTGNVTDLSDDAIRKELGLE